MTVCSKRCRPPIHSADLTIVYRSSSSCVCPLTCPLLCFRDIFSRLAFVIEVLPVASRPCKMRFRHGAARIYQCISSEATKDDFSRVY